MSQEAKTSIFTCCIWANPQIPVLAGEPLTIQLLKSTCLLLRSPIKASQSMFNLSEITTFSRFAAYIPFFRLFHLPFGCYFYRVPPEDRSEGPGSARWSRLCYCSFCCRNMPGAGLNQTSGRRMCTKYRGFLLGKVVGMCEHL